MKLLQSITVRNAAGEPVDLRDASPQRVRAAVTRILAENVLCSIATVSPSNRAHINTAYFAYTDNFQICFLFHPTSQHCQNVRTTPTMAVCVYSSAQNWTGPDQGLQLFGVCQEASGGQARSAAELYARRFSHYQAWAAGLGRTDPAREYQFFWFTAQQIKLLDEPEFGEGLFISAIVTG